MPSVFGLTGAGIDSAGYHSMLHTAVRTGHQLPKLLQSVADLGLLRADGDRDQVLRDSVQAIARRWFNNLRFASTRFVHTQWWARGIVTDQWTLKQAAQAFYEDCAATTSASR